MPVAAVENTIYLLLLHAWTVWYTRCHLSHWTLFNASVQLLLNGSVFL